MEVCDITVRPGANLQVAHVSHLTSDGVEVLLGSTDMWTVERHDVVGLDAAEQVLHQPLPKTQATTVAPGEHRANCCSLLEFNLDVRE